MNLSHHPVLPSYPSSDLTVPLSVPLWFTRLERGFTIGVVMYHTSFMYLPLAGRLSAEDPMSNRSPVLEGSPMLALLKGLMWIVLFFLVSQRWRSIGRLMMRRTGLLMLMGWILASCFWAPDFNYSWKAANELCIVTLTGFYLAARFSLREFLNLAAIALGLVAGINFLYCLAVPSVGLQIGIQAGAWRGVFIQKNTLSRMMFFSTLVFLSLISTQDPNDRSKLFWYRGGMILCTLLTLLSQSKTGLLLILGFALLVPLLKVLRSRHPVVPPIVFCALLIATMILVFVVGNYEAILAALGRDTTLSGRTDIWGVLVDKIAQRPWTGYGYSGFWQGKEGESIDVWYVARDMPPHGHNGYLDMALDLGLVGLGIFLVNVVQGLVRSFRWLRQMPMVEGLFPILYLSALLVYNIAEDSFIGESSFNLIWLLYCYVTSAILISQIPHKSPSLNDRPTTER